MNEGDWRPAPRRLAPQLITACRLPLGAGALVAALRGHHQLSATLVTLGAVVGGLDGPVARWLGVTTPFGALFDYFSDYLCLMVLWGTREKWVCQISPVEAMTWQRGRHQFLC